MRSGCPGQSSRDTVRRSQLSLPCGCIWGRLTNTLRLLAILSWAQINMTTNLKPSYWGAFPTFPIHLLADIYESSTWGRGTVILPNTTDERCKYFSSYEVVSTELRIQADGCVYRHSSRGLSCQLSTSSSSKPQPERA